MRDDVGSLLVSFANHQGLGTADTQLSALLSITNAKRPHLHKKGQLWRAPEGLYMQSEIRAEEGDIIDTIEHAILHEPDTYVTDESAKKAFDSKLYTLNEQILCVLRRAVRLHRAAASVVYIIGL